MKISTVLASVMTAGVALAATASPASADLVTRCVGTGGAVTVPGDLVVPKGESCTLTGTTVEGNVRVAQGADLVVADVTLKGSVNVAPDAYFDATTSAVTGTVTNRGFGLYLDRSDVGENVRARAAADASSFTYLYNSSIAGNVDARAGELLVDSSSVAGPVRGLGTVFADIQNSTLSGSLTVQNNAEGTSVCASEVDGDVEMTGNAGVQLGEGSLVNDCTDGMNYLGGNVAISNNSMGVTVNGNIVRGNLSGAGNDPAPTGSDNRVRGESGGQFSELAPAPQARARMMAVPSDRAEDTRDAVEQRRIDALTQATAAGPALL